MPQASYGFTSRSRIAIERAQVGKALAVGIVRRAQGVERRMHRARAVASYDNVRRREALGCVSNPTAVLSGTGIECLRFCRDGLPREA